jgi:DNA-binding NarL/FixJ family response regulator
LSTLEPGDSEQRESDEESGAQIDLARLSGLPDVPEPLVDGVTAIARLRGDHPSLCLIAITGDREPQLLSAVEEAGADAVLLKEELVETLVDRLRHLRQTA